ncbi:hypothetical protein D3C87_1927170 [compost metagenome]
MLIGDLGEIAEGLDGVLVDPLAVFIHRPELPERQRPPSGCVAFQRRKIGVARDNGPGAVKRPGKIEGSVGGRLRMGRRGRGQHGQH